MGNIANRVRGGLSPQGILPGGNLGGIPSPAPSPITPAPNPALAANPMDRGGGGLISRIAGGAPNSPTPPLAPPTGPMIGPDISRLPERGIVPTTVDQSQGAGTITAPVSPTAGSKAKLGPMLNNPNLPVPSFGSKVAPGISGVISKLVNPGVKAAPMGSPVGVGPGEFTQAPAAGKQLPKPNMQKAQRMNPAEVPNRQRRMY